MRVITIPTRASAIDGFTTPAPLEPSAVAEAEGVDDAGEVAVPSGAPGLLVELAFAMTASRAEDGNAETVWPLGSKTPLYATEYPDGRLCGQCVRAKSRRSGIGNLRSDGLSRGDEAGRVDVRLEKVHG